MKIDKKLSDRIEYFIHPLNMWTDREQDIVNCLKDLFKITTYKEKDGASNANTQ